MANNGPGKDRKGNLWKRFSVQLEGLFLNQAEPEVALTPVPAAAQSSARSEKKENFLKRLSVQLFPPVTESDMPTEGTQAPELIEVQLISSWHHKITGFHSSQEAGQVVPPPDPPSVQKADNIPERKDSNLRSHSRLHKSSEKQQRASVIGMFSDNEISQDQTKEKKTHNVDDLSELVKALARMDLPSTSFQPAVPPVIQRRSSIIINEQEKEGSSKELDNKRKNKP